MKRSAKILLVVMPFLLGIVLSQPAGFERRILLEINPANVSGITDLINFPLLVSFTHNDLRTTANGGDMQNPSGFDIFYTAGDGSTPLEFEIEEYDGATGTIITWVKIPALSATATTGLYLYFSNSSVFTNPSSATVWDTNYMAVYHFQNDVNDDGQNGNDLIDYSTSTNLNGKIGNAREFTGVGDYLEDPDAEDVYLNGLDSLTISAWVKANSIGNDGGIMFGRNPSSPGNDNRIGIRYDASGYGGTNIIKIAIRVNDNGTKKNMRRNSLNNVQTTNWQHIVLTWENGIVPNLYIDGSLSHGSYSSSAFAGVTASNSTLMVGRSSRDGPTTSWDGLIDEFRMDSSMKSADWVATEYANQNSPGTFLIENTTNESPELLNIEAIALAYSNGDPAANITSALTVFDYNHMNMSGATVSISANYNSSTDTLVYTSLPGISGSWVDGTGTLNFTGSASKSDYNTLLQSIQFSSSDPVVSTRTISFQVNDGLVSSTVVTRGIQVNTPNSPPVLSGIEGAALNFIDGQGQTAVTSTIIVSETDDAYLDTAIIQITANYQDGEDRLYFTTSNGISKIWSTANGVLTLSGSASIAQYQQALRSVMYDNISHDPVELTRTLSFTVNDGTDPSNTITRNVTVTKANDAPILDNIETDALAYSPGDPATVISNTVTVSDYDDTQIDSAKIVFTQGYLISDDTLVYPGGYGITDSWVDATGKLLLAGTATIANYQLALRSITYQNTNASTPSSVGRSVTLFVNDGLLESVGKSRAISSNIPGTISNLDLWLRADAGVFTNDGITPTPPDGNARFWYDQSGNGRNFDANNPRPLLRTNVVSLNGGNAVEMTGNQGNRYRDADGELYINGSTELTAFFVIQSNLTNSDHGFLSTKKVSDKDRFFSLRYDAAGNLGPGINGLKASIVDANDINMMESSSEKQTTDPQIVCLDWKSGQVYDFYLDGVLDSPTYRGSLPVGPISGATVIYLGRGPYDTNGSWSGYLAEIIFYGRHLTESERVKVEDYLSTKYDIPVRLIGPATGGEAISADSANITFTPLSGPRIREDVIGELLSGGTIVLNAPVGYEWNTGTTPTVTINPAFGTSTTLAVSYSSSTTSQITFTVNAASSNPTFPGEVTFGNIEIRPTTGILPNTGNITNTGTTGPSSNTSLGTITMVAGAKSKILYVQQPTTGTVNEILSPAIEVSVNDQYDNPVEENNIPLAIALTSGTGNLSGNFTQNTDMAGHAVFNDLVIDQLGLKQLTVSGSGLTSAVSNSFNINAPNTLTSFLIERPSGGDILDQVAGSLFNVKITARDGGGVLVSDFTGTVEITSSGILSQGGGTTPSFVGGELLNHSITITNSGTFSITATNTSGPELGTSNLFAVSPGQADIDSSTIEASPTIIVNNGVSTSTITVTLKDEFGNQLVSGGDVVNLLTSAGTLLGTVTDNNDGTYTQSLQSSMVEVTATVSGIVNSQTIVDNALVTFSQVNVTWESDPGNDAYTTDWNDYRNWSSGAVPTTADIILIPAVPAEGNKQPIVSANSSVGGIVVELGADVTVQSNAILTVTGKVIGDGDVNGSAGTTIEIGGNINIGTMSVPNVVLNGSTVQYFDSPSSFANLEINSTNEILCSNNLSITGTLTLTNGLLTITSGKSLIANTKSITTGQLKFKRDIVGSTGWRMIASPVLSTYGDLLDSIFTQGYTGSDSATGSPSVLWYDESYAGTDNQRWRKPGSSTDATVPGRGLFVYVFGDIPGDAAYSNPLPLTLDVTGSEEEGLAGEFDFGITYTATGDTGWNLIGNPFGATIDWDSPSWTKTNVEQTIYVWDNTANAGNGDYLLWNGVTGSLGSGLLPPFQGFWIKASASTPVLSINKTAKTSGGVFYKVLEESNPEIVLLLEADTLETMTYVAFHPGASLRHDTYDGYKLKPLTDTFVDLGTVRADGKILSINSLPDRFGIPMEIPVITGGQVKDQVLSGEFRMCWPKLAHIPEGWTVTLVDNFTNSTIDLLTEIQYFFTEFNAVKTLREKPEIGEEVKLIPQIQHRRSINSHSRFVLRINPGNAFPNIPKEYSVNPNYPNPFNPKTTIQINLPLESRVAVKIYNLLGQEVEQLPSQIFSAGKHNFIWNAESLSSGVYIAKVMINDQYYTQKMTVLK